MSKQNSAPGIDLSSATQIKPEDVIREKVDPSQFAALYVNDIQMDLTPFDVRLILGLVTEGPTPERQTIKVSTIGEIRMSPQLAKQLAALLVGNLRNYELTVGIIPGGPALQVKKQEST